MDRYERVNMIEEKIIEQLGCEEALAAICKALSTDDKEDIYEYICRCYDVKIEDDDDEEY